jgi:hypothetical protein
MHHELVTVETIGHDGMRVRASAGSDRETLQAINNAQSCRCTSRQLEFEKSSPRNNNSYIQSKKLTA